MSHSRKRDLLILEPKPADLRLEPPWPDIPPEPTPPTPSATITIMFRQIVVVPLIVVLPTPRWASLCVRV